MTASERIIEASADEDVRDVIDVLRLDYPRVVEHDGLAEAA